MDTYAEHLIRRKTPVYSYILNPLMIVLTAVSLFLALTTNVFAVIIMLILAGLTYLSIRGSVIEYEYIFVEDQLRIDRILGRSKRKKMAEFMIHDVIVLAPADDEKIISLTSQSMQTLNFTSRISTHKVYAAIVENKGAKRRILFEPNEKIMNCCYQKAPSKVIL